MYFRVETHFQMKTTTLVDISIKSNRMNKPLVRDLVELLHAPAPHPPPTLRAFAPPQALKDSCNKTHM